MPTADAAPLGDLGRQPSHHARRHEGCSGPASARQIGADVDITDAYTAARKRVFETCPRVALPGRPGQAVLLHRLSLHGVAPWRDGARRPRHRPHDRLFPPASAIGQESWARAALAASIRAIRPPRRLAMRGARLGSSSRMAARAAFVRRDQEEISSIERRQPTQMRSSG